MIHIRVPPFNTVPWPYGMHTFKRMCDDAPVTVADLAEVVYDRLQDVPAVNRSWRLVNVYTEFGKSVGSLGVPPKGTYTQPARLVFTFARKGFPDYGQPRHIFMANSDVKYFKYETARVQGSGQADFVSVRLTPSDCSRFGCTDMSVRAMNAYYYAVGSIIMNRLMSSNLNRGMSPPDGPSTVRQHAYEDWGACEDLWVTPMLTKLHVERNPYEGIRAFMKLGMGYGNSKIVNRYVVGPDGLGNQLRSIVGAERQRARGIELPYINRLSDRAMSVLMMAPVRYVRNDQPFIRELLAMG